MIDEHISSLIKFYIENKYITKDDVRYCFNKILFLLKLNEGKYIKHSKVELYDSLNSIVDFAVENNVIDAYSYSRDNFEAKITDVFLDKPSLINAECQEKGINNYLPKFLKMSIDSNYVKYKELKKNIEYKVHGEKGDIDISINLAKPEKDPKEIEKLKNIQSTSYPKCPLCIENVGFYGNETKAARSNLRTLNIRLNNENWHFQYSPYMYFDEHSIILSEKHQAMIIDDNVIKYQLDFVEQIPNYIIGTNAGIPIVGGSILGHNHYQAGKRVFPMEMCNIIKTFQLDDVQIDYLDWYLQTIRLSSSSRESLIYRVNKIYRKFNSYKKDEINLFNDNNNHSVNIITRKESSLYIVYIIFRNNSTTNEYPYGLFHPSEELHHIKKENIGLIEAMGLAILPGRLEKEMKNIELYINSSSEIIEEKHEAFAKRIKRDYNNQPVNEYVKNKVGLEFEKVLKACDIFRYQEDISMKIKYIEEIIYD